MRTVARAHTQHTRVQKPTKKGAKSTKKNTPLDTQLIVFAGMEKYIYSIIINTFFFCIINIFLELKNIYFLDCQ